MAQQRDRAVDRPLRRQAPRQSGNARSPERGVNLPALRAIVASAAQDVNYDLEHCSAKRLGRRYVVEIVVDGDEELTWTALPNFLGRSRGRSIAPRRTEKTLSRVSMTLRLDLRGWTGR